MRARVSCAATPLLILSLTLVRASTGMAEERIRGAFGQVLGERFDTVRALGVSQDETALVFDFSPPEPFQWLSQFTAMVTPMTYRIYSIAGRQPASTPAKCQSDAKALTYVVNEKYAGAQYHAQLGALTDGTGWRIDQGRRHIVIRCLKISELSMRYWDDEVSAVARTEQQDWNAIVADYVAGRYAKVLPRLRELGNGGHVQAQVLLGDLFAGKLSNPSEALTWFERAARSGHMEAQYNACQILSKPGGTARDLVHAYFWCHLAALQGHAAAEEKQTSLGRTLTPTALAEARALAAKFLEQRTGRR